MKYDSTLFIEDREISIESPTYFIADLASNHNGDLARAKELIYLAKEAGANAVKFQHFLAQKIVSDRGFRSLKQGFGHQANWNKSVYEIYKQYECDRTWTSSLLETAREAGITLLTTPYDFEALDLFDMPAFKIGSGDITWISFIEAIAQKGKPVLLATGASTMGDTIRAVESILKHTPKIALMQCNTNYSGTLENFRYVNLNVLKSFTVKYPQMLLGLSDHTPGHAAVLGAITLGARIIEKHFTSDNSLSGPDHAFSLNPLSWREMVIRSRELELALGDGYKNIEKNEEETVVIQRRSLRLTRPLSEGTILQDGDLEALRPAPLGSIEPYRISEVLGRTLSNTKELGDCITMADLRD